MLQLCDKWAFPLAMHKAQAWVCVEACTAAPGTFPHLTSAASALRVLRLRRLLVRLGLVEADRVLQHVMAQDVRPPPLTVIAGTTAHRSSSSTLLSSSTMLMAHCYKCKASRCVQLASSSSACTCQVRGK